MLVLLEAKRAEYHLEMGLVSRLVKEFLLVRVLQMCNQVVVIQITCSQ